MASGSRGIVAWGSDVPISMPAPLRTGQVAYVAMGGFCFTAQGIAHNLRETDLEVYTTPMFAPTHQGQAGETP
jgi:hypothetical protein